MQVSLRAKDFFVIHFSISTRHGGPDSSNKVLVGKADEVIPRGAFGASAQINMGSPNEGIMIERMGTLSRDCFHEGIPLLGMVYEEEKISIQSKGMNRCALLTQQD